MTTTATHAFVPYRFLETETRCHCGELKSKCPVWADELKPRVLLTVQDEYGDEPVGDFQLAGDWTTRWCDVETAQQIAELLGVELEVKGL